MVQPRLFPAPLFAFCRLFICDPAAITVQLAGGQAKKIEKERVYVP